MTFVQRRLNVFDVGPTLYKCYTNILRLLGCVMFRKCFIIYNNMILEGVLTPAMNDQQLAIILAAGISSSELRRELLMNSLLW